ncbi:MAG TPA: YfiR family protein [Verrucomicrobiae bacterium]|nr:YfiR family protein [Verrucomicrobiae bacterium]
MVSPLSIFSGCAPGRRSGGITGKGLGSYCSIVLLTLCFCDLAAAQASREYQIKAVLLLNLTRFVNWPDTAFAAPDSPIVIGIVGRDPFGGALDEVVKGEQVNGRSIVVERYPTAQQIKPCQILFVSRSEKEHIKQILARAQYRPVLTVSEMEGFAEPGGGMVRLYVNEQKRVRLQVNLQAVQEHDLKLSAKLLQVAEVTRGRPIP